MSGQGETARCNYHQSTQSVTDHATASTVDNDDDAGKQAAASATRAYIQCPSCHSAIRASQRRRDTVTVRDAASSDNANDHSSDAQCARARVDAAVSQSAALAAHLKRCPKRVSDDASTNLPLYEQNINGVWIGNENEAAAMASSADDATADGHAIIPSSLSTLHLVPRAALWKCLLLLRKIALEMNITPESMTDADRNAPIQLNHADGQHSADGRNADDHMTSSPSAAATAAPSRLSTRSRLRHNLQHAGFFSILRCHGLLPSGSLFVEVGAGKAGLSAYLALSTCEGAKSDEHEHEHEQSASQGSNANCNIPSTPIDDETQQPPQSKRQKIQQYETASTLARSSAPASDPPSSPSAPSYTFVVLDRGSFKNKRDRHVLRLSSGASVAAPILRRHRIDLQHVRLERMKEVVDMQQRRDELQRQTLCSQQQSLPLTLVIGKHVCGQATDFVCKTVARANSQRSTAPGPDPSSHSHSRSPLITCLAVATCCHHLCSWQNYVNQTFIRSLFHRMASDADFNGNAADEVSSHPLRSRSQSLQHQQQQQQRTHTLELEFPFETIFHWLTRMSTWATVNTNMEQANGLRKHDVGLTLEQVDEYASTLCEDNSNSDHLVHLTPASLNLPIPPVSVDPLHPTFLLSASTRRYFGFVCKHLLDLGRLRFLQGVTEDSGPRSSGVEAQLSSTSVVRAQRLPYCSSEVTRENFMLLVDFRPMQA